MESTISRITERRAALLAGSGYLVLFFLAIFANFFVRSGLVDPDSVSVTYANITDSEGLFRAGMVAFLAVFVIDVGIAWALYLLFRRQRPEVSLLTAWLRLVYTVMLGVALVFLFLVVDFVSGQSSLEAFDLPQREAQVGLLLDAFNYAWLIGLVAFGVHVILLGYLTASTRAAPRALSVLLVVAGSAYIVDTLANALLPSYDDYASLFLAIVAIPAVIAELWFTFWLLFKGGTGGTPESVGAGARQSSLA
jgi:hypothetical protein